MNLTAHPSKTGPNNGNALIYVLLALALLAALTMMMTRQGDQGGDDISDEQAQIYATKLIAEAATAKHVMDQMVSTGTTFANFTAQLPNDANFQTAPTKDKFYHPDGGGMIYETAVIPPFLVGSTPAPGWYISKRSNVEWTPTANNEVIFSAFNIDPKICAAINKILTGDPVIPNIAGGSSTRILFANHAAADPLNSTTCPGCVGHTQLCVGSSGLTFYSIILTQ